MDSMARNRGVRSNNRGRKRKNRSRVQREKRFKKRQSTSSNALNSNTFNVSPNRVISRVEGMAIPDTFKRKYKYSEIQRIAFATAVQFGSVVWNMTSMNAIQNGGSTAIIPDWSLGSTLDGDNKYYRRYVVNRSFLCVQVRNRELVNPVVCMIYPTQTAAGVASTGEFVWRQANSYCSVKQLGPAGSADASHTFRMSFNPEKFFSKQYLALQDEYTGALSQTTGPSNPATMAFWNLAFINVNTNTLTTGGVIIDVTIEQEATCFQVDRDDDPTTLMHKYDLTDGALVLKPRSEIDDLASQIEGLKLKIRKLESGVR